MHKNAQRLAAVVIACGLVACADTGADKRQAAAKPVAPPPLRAQGDFYRYVNAAWLADNEIPPDRARWGSFDQLRDNAVMQALTVIEEAEAAGAKGTADQRKMATLYASFMDENRLEGLGAKPIAPQMRAINAIKSKRELPTVIAQFNELNIMTPIRLYIGQDARDPTRYIPTIYQSGLGMPDRDYYLKDDDAQLVATRAKYAAHVSRMLTLAGVPDADTASDQVLAIETALAKVQWTRVENRDPVKTYNKLALGKLDPLTPGYSWKNWATSVRIAGKVDAVIVAQPTYLEGFAKAVDTLPLDAWKSYLKFRVVASCAPYLSKPFAEESFAFEGGVLAGTPLQLPRWKRGVGAVESSIGEGLGKLYVAKFFPAENKARMDAMVKNILAAYKVSIDSLDWMGPETKKEAQAKLAKFDPKIAYPTKWRDYTALSFKSDDLLGNVMRARRFESARDLAKLGKPIDRTEWGMTPQTVNAYYNRGRNEIVFPAAILQPPFFDVKADDATNYGAIGAVIGHEISHGFDDSGSQSDGDGRLRDWWTAEDRMRFNAKTKALVAEYDAFEPLPGYHVNGALTLGENIADNSGLAISYKAYHLSLNGKDAPVIDGQTGDQRFYAGFATIYRNKIREPALIRQIKSDPHSPGEYRTNGTIRNQNPFYEAYGVKPGDGMYEPPEQRVQIW